jgi:hypothetical protein
MGRTMRDINETLLNQIKLVFNKNINILPIDKGEYKCIASDIQTSNILDQLYKLKQYYYDHK